MDSVCHLLTRAVWSSGTDRRAGKREPNDLLLLILMIELVRPHGMWKAIDTFH